jgi:hypothetical protein
MGDRFAKMEGLILPDDKKDWALGAQSFFMNMSIPPAAFP